MMKVGFPESPQKSISREDLGKSID